MRKFKVLDNWNCSEMNIVEVSLNKRFVLTQPYKLIDEDFYSITRTVADPIDFGNLENIYIVTWLENSGVGGTVSCMKIIDEETMIDIIQNDINGLLQGRIDFKRYFDENTVTKETNIKSWYMKEFPTDDVGKTLNDDVTFKIAYEKLPLGSGFYDVIGGYADTVVRERIFEELSKIYNCSYDDIYNIWLEGGD